MKSIGIITIHKINNYGSVLQAYALQRECERLGYKAEIIDYNFPNEFHQSAGNIIESPSDKQPTEPRWIKLLFAAAIIRQHKGIQNFVKRYLNTSDIQYNSPQELLDNPPKYDIYITGSDQLWSPRYCKGDPAFMLHFAPDNSKKISYAASIGSNTIPTKLESQYKQLLSRYNYISVREKSGSELLHELLNKEVSVVVDPTLLLNKNDWNTIASQKRIINRKYILCYFLNYTFNAFPYVEELAKDIQKQTGYEIVKVARPPHSLTSDCAYRVGATPEEFLALIRDAEIVLTTSFHGTAFALNFARPLFTIVQNRDSSDSRQANIMRSLGLEKQIVSMNDPFPDYRTASYDVNDEQRRLDSLRENSKQYLIESLQR